jgi:hypothetical protein
MLLCCPATSETQVERMLAAFEDLTAALAGRCR